MSGFVLIPAHRLECSASLQTFIVYSEKNLSILHGELKMQNEDPSFTALLAFKIQIFITTNYKS